MARDRRPECPDCDMEFSRRQFLATTGAALAVGSFGASQAFAAPTPKSDAEQAVKRLYGTLSDEQKKVIALPWSDERRTRINANWRITDAKVGTLTKDQQEIVKEVIKGVTSEDGYERFMRQMQEDNGGIQSYAIAIFGEPDSDQCEFELTGRHLTLRADGNTTPGAAFGGPIVYGHGQSDTAKNLYFYQTQSTNEVFKALDGKQRKAALLARAPQESAVQLRDADAIPGIAGSDLSADQRELVASALANVLSPYRQEDIDEAMACVKAGGGIEGLHMAFYQTGDLNDDGVWDVWRIEGPNLVCHFRGAPHVHAYINVATKS